MANRIHLSSDGYRVYIDAVDDVFGVDVDYGMLVKIYGKVAHGEGPERRYSPMQCVGARRLKAIGKPDKRHISTSFVERNNGTIRQHCKRYARLTLAFSKKIEN